MNGIVIHNGQTNRHVFIFMHKEFWIMRDIENGEYKNQFLLANKNFLEDHGLLLS